MNSKTMIRYIHGSEDSTDLDVCYVYEDSCKLPPFEVCKRFCDEKKDENANIIAMCDGVVSDCYKGTIDEINNALLVTYKLHHQDYPLVVCRKVERNKPLKYIRAVRIILSHLSRSQYRADVKSALRGSWTERLNVLSSIDLNKIDFGTLNKKMNAKDVCKVIAFQIGQVLGLIDGTELYTKGDIASRYHDLAQFVYREDCVDIHILNDMLHYMVDSIKAISYNDLDNGHVLFIDENKTFDLMTEKMGCE